MADGAVYPCASACFRLATDSASSSSSMKSETISDGLATSVRDLVPTTISWTCDVSQMSPVSVRMAADIFLGSGQFKDTFFNRTSCNKSIYRDLLGLANTMCPIHSLGVVRGIPIMVV